MARPGFVDMTDAHPWPPWEDGPVPDERPSGLLEQVKRLYTIECRCGHSARLDLTPHDAVSRRFRCSRCGAAAAPIL